MNKKYRKVNPAPCDVLPEPHFLQGICEQGHRKMESEFRQSPYRAIRAARLKGHSSEVIEVWSFWGVMGPQGHLGLNLPSRAVTRHK